MQGTKVAVTDSVGKYRFINVPPGDGYQVSASLATYQTLSKTGFRISLGQEATGDYLALTVALAESITVTAESPLADVTQTTTGTNVTSHQFAALPTARSFQALTAMAAGVSMDMAQRAQSENALENSPAVERVVVVGPSRTVRELLAASGVAAPKVACRCA